MRRRGEFAVLSRWRRMESLLGMRHTFNLFAPFFGAGVRVTRIAEDFTSIDVELRMRWYNRNYVGSHFGGSLYSMCDPFFMFMLMKNLGPDYIVWDRAASIEFLRPGQGTVRARFTVSPERLDGIRAEVTEKRKMDVHFDVDVVDATGALVAHVQKTLYVRAQKETGARRSVGQTSKSTSHSSS